LSLVWNCMERAVSVCNWSDKRWSNRNIQYSCAVCRSVLLGGLFLFKLMLNKKQPYYGLLCRCVTKAMIFLYFVFVRVWVCLWSW
jgi:hypothetical protein